MNTLKERRILFDEEQNLEIICFKIIIKIIFIFCFLSSSYFIKIKSRTYGFNRGKEKQKYILEDILESQIYEKFEKVKKKYYTISFLNLI